MNRNRMVSFCFALSVGLIACAFTCLVISRRDSRLLFEGLNEVCAGVLEREPEAAPVLLAVLKECGGRPASRPDILSQWGYCPADFASFSSRQNFLFSALAGFAGGLLFMSVFLCQSRKRARRIQALADYLEQVNTGAPALLTPSGEDDFSKLEDEIYKTVTFLYQTREAAVAARDGFAENLSNIAHQVKTPITAISLSLQAARKESEGLCRQVQKHLLRLTRLQEALLVLARLDAGTLLLQKGEADVFTLLVLAADNLQELAARLGVSVDIPEGEGMAVTADLDWTMEAVMNLMKNCMEHAKGGRVCCSYAQNPLYTEILIWDEGAGFAKEDLPRLFERFYRGRDACEGGIGIGLALAKEIVERQNGTLRARNRPEGGALFEIRFYCH